MDLSTILLNNLMNVYRNYNCKTYSDLSSILNVNYNTLKGWMAHSKQPSLSTLDAIANNLHIRTSELLNPDFDIDTAPRASKNRSAVNFRRNLQLVFIQNNCTSWNSRLTILYGFISIDSLKAFFRNNHPNSPSLLQLEHIASALGIKPYELIAEEFTYEKRNK